MDLFFKVEGVGTEIGLVETVGCVVSVGAPPSVVAGVVVVLVAIDDKVNLVHNTHISQITNDLTV